MRCGDCAKMLNHAWENVIVWYLKAYDQFHRVEPLVKIAEYYVVNNNWRSAYMYLSEACKLEYPHDCILFIENGAYDYKRWSLMGIVAYYNGKFEEGKNACLKALEHSPNNPIEINNLKHYDAKDTELKESKNITELSKEQKKEILKQKIREKRNKNR
jgi:hypothetical protein